MNQRGRKSTAALSVVAAEERFERPKPPEKLSEAEGEVWKQVVAVKPADWFTADNLPLLADYCRHIVRQDKISEMINGHSVYASDPEALKTYNHLIRLSDLESKAIAMLATKMRLTHSAKYRVDRPHSNPEAKKRPWEK